MKSVCSFWLLFVCCLAELTVFAVISFGQTLPASQQLRLLQPNGKERLQSGSEYTIKWTGIDSARPVRLEYSTNGGKSWKRITDKALGGSYLWKPIPNEPSDSCLILATGMAADSTESVGRSLVRFQVKQVKTQNNQYQAPSNVSFSPDGTKILVSSWSNPVMFGTTFYGWKQFDVEVRDGRTGAVLYNLPPYISNAISPPRHSWWWSSAFSGGYNGGIKTPSSWHPDNKSFLTQITDSTLGIYDAQTGVIIRSIAVPTRGARTRILGVQWTGAGQEILTSVQYHFLNQARSDGVLDTMRTVMMRLNAATGVLSNVPFQIGMIVWFGSGCYYSWGNGGLEYASHDGERWISSSSDTVSCNNNSNYITIRSTRDNSLLQTIDNIPRTRSNLNIGNNNDNYYGGGYFPWSPNDSLLVFHLSPDDSSSASVLFINSYTYQVVQKINSSGSDAVNAKTSGSALELLSVHLSA